MKRSLVCRGVPKPANCRIVQSRLRYMRGVHAARERILAGIAEVGLGVEAVQIVRRVERLDRHAADRGGRLLADRRPASSSAQRSLSARSAFSVRLMLESFQTKTQVGRIELSQRMDSPATLRNAEPRELGLPDALIRHICYVLWHTTTEGSRPDTAGRKKGTRRRAVAVLLALGRTIASSAAVGMPQGRRGQVRPV